MTSRIDSNSQTISYTYDQLNRLTQKTYPDFLGVPRKGGPDKAMNKVLTWFIDGWIVLAAILNVAAIVGLFIGEATFWAGVKRVQDMYSPFNVGNWLIEVALLSPALVAIYWRNKRRTRDKV